jgi:hypothetical protein
MSPDPIDVITSKSILKILREETNWDLDVSSRMTIKKILNIRLEKL